MKRDGPFPAWSDDASALYVVEKTGGFPTGPVHPFDDGCVAQVAHTEQDRRSAVQPHVPLDVSQVGAVGVQCEEKKRARVVLFQKGLDVLVRTNQEPVLPGGFRRPVPGFGGGRTGSSSFVVG